MSGFSKTGGVLRAAVLPEAAACLSAECPAAAGLAKAGRAGAAIGRADLLQALLATDAGRKDAVAAVFGYSVRLDDEAPLAGTAGEVKALQPQERWLRPEWVERRGDVGSRPIHAGPPLEPTEFGRVSGTTPKPPALASWAQLWPRLHGALPVVSASAELDVPRLVGLLSRVEAIGARSLPRLMRRGWPGHVLVLVDRCPRLAPFYRDQAALCDRLRRAFGVHALSVRLLPGGPNSRSLAPGGRAPNRPIPAGAAVLALTDLGGYGTPADRASWRRCAGQLRGTGHTLVALCPVPAARLPAFAAQWHALPWERLAAPDPEQRANGRQRQERVEHLLTMLSFALRVEPGLLRAVRRLLPSARTDVGTEADVWTRGAVRGHSVAFSIVPEMAAALRGRLKEVPRELLRRVAQEVRAWHAGLPQEIWHAEVLTLASYVPGLLRDDEHRAREFFARLPATLPNLGTAPILQRGFRDWFDRISSRLPDPLWSDPQLGDGLSHLWAATHREDAWATAPPGIDPAALRAQGPARAFDLYQEGDRLRIVPSDASPSGTAEGLVGRMLAVAPLVTIQGGRRPRQVHLEKQPLLLDLPAAPTLMTDRTVIKLSAFRRPAWAWDLGRDGHGLWVDVDVAGVVIRLRWIPGGRFWMGSPPQEHGRWDNEGPRHRVALTRGYFLSETPCTQALWEAVMKSNPSRFSGPERPVERVRWGECQRFLAAVNAQVKGLDARLPTEAEWEHACRAGTETSTYAGDLEFVEARAVPPLDGIAWYSANSGHETHPVGLKAPNVWGLRDMLGNVWEWCAGGRREYGSQPVVDPAGVAGAGRVIRGGSWLDGARSVRAASRRSYEPVYRFGSLGFRIAAGGGRVGDEIVRHKTE